MALAPLVLPRGGKGKGGGNKRNRYWFGRGGPVTTWEKLLSKKKLPPWPVVFSSGSARRFSLVCGKMVVSGSRQGSPTRQGANESVGERLEGGMGGVGDVGIYS